jgi:hypothetical protein
MPETATATFPLRVVDGRRLEKRVRDALDPGGVLSDASGRARQLPRYFYEIPTWEDAVRTQLAPNFHLWELVQSDVREASPLRAFPRYVPCAVTLLAFALERFRDHVGTTVHVAANGGYRSPRHALTRGASPHCWATAANVYRIGDTYLDNADVIERYAAIARDVLPGVWIRPFGGGPGEVDDHLHIDVGYVVSTPRDAPGEPYHPKLEWGAL